MSLGLVRKRVLYVEQNTDGTVGGSHFSLLDLLAHLDRERFDPRLILYESSALLPRFQQLLPVQIVAPPRPWKLVDRSPRSEGAWISLPFRALQKAVNFVYVSMGSVPRWWWLLVRHRIDILHLNNSMFGAEGWAIAARLAGVRCVCHQRGYGPQRPAPAARHLDRVICISDQIRDHIVKFNPTLHDKVLVWYSIDTDAFRSLARVERREVRKQWGIPDDALLLGIVGNIKEWKGQRVVVEAVERLRVEHPTLRCVIVGAVARNGRDREYHDLVQRLIQEYGLGDRVIVTGFRDDVPDLVNALDIVVHASVSPEPMGRVILEAMTLEKPVIATDHGGPREIIESGVSGFLVPPNDPDCLAEVLRRLAASLELRHRIGQAAARRVEDEFGVRRQIARLHDLYDSLSTEPNRDTRGFVVPISD